MAGLGYSSSSDARFSNSRSSHAVVSSAALSDSLRFAANASEEFGTIVLLAPDNLINYGDIVYPDGLRAGASSSSAAPVFGAGSGDA